jgi:hypothetical protein
VLLDGDADAGDQRVARFSRRVEVEVLRPRPGRARTDVEYINIDKLGQ